MMNRIQASSWGSALVVAIVVWSLASCSIAADSPRRILLIGQGPDGHPPATHEYNPGIKLLHTLLKKHDRLSVNVTVADGNWSEGPALLAEADTAVLFVSQGAKWIQDDSRRMEAFARLAERRGGLVVLHWGMGTREAQFIDPFVKLFGGCHGGPDRKYQVVKTTLAAASNNHPIARGFAPLEVNEEFYYRLKLAKDPAPIPVLQADIDGNKETVAWAWERPDGGRSSGFSGLHFHENWSLPGYRRLVVQSVLWTSRQEIPNDGVNVEVNDDDLRLPPVVSAGTQ